MKRLKRYFAAGVLVGLPVFLTFYLLFIIFKFLDSLFGVIINKYLKEALGFTLPGMGLILGVLLILITGFVVSHLLSKKALPVIEGWFLKLPAIRQVYPPIKEIVGFIFSRDKPAFKKVVLVEYPSAGIWSVGFMTNDGFREAQEKLGQELVHVLIGSTPSPWSGFFILVPKTKVKFLEMSVEEGMKLIISGGILKPSQ
ncbi:MAG: DUF502 domain-containing protein [Candidatus Omnitrophica bacterium]|nr:DUF502 domain-containing protein [Candidatus Omnitrophota bacterium]MDD5027563.1 DUF502 domain-containing protein [Candidatus Omnitrophota bacterium]MDD5661916.1 DUF502 domain-containing protein [Candidatus Omnitrophota bacterium]